MPLFIMSPFPLADGEGPGGGKGGGGWRRRGRRGGGRRVATGSRLELAAGCPGVRHRGDDFFTVQVRPVFCRLDCTNDDSP